MGITKTEAASCESHCFTSGECPWFFFSVWCYSVLLYRSGQSVCGVLSQKKACIAAELSPRVGTWDENKKGTQDRKRRQTLPFADTSRDEI